MTTIYHMDLGRLVMTHYCSLGSQPYLVALPNEEEDITFKFVKLGNMIDVNAMQISHGVINDCNQCNFLFKLGREF